MAAECSSCSASVKPPDRSITIRTVSWAVYLSTPRPSTVGKTRREAKTIECVGEHILHEKTSRNVVIPLCLVRPTRSALGRSSEDSCQRQCRSRRCSYKRRRHDAYSSSVYMTAEGERVKNNVDAVKHYCSGRAYEYNVRGCSLIFTTPSTLILSKRIPLA